MPSPARGRALRVVRANVPMPDVRGTVPTRDRGMPPVHGGARCGPRGQVGTAMKRPAPPASRPLAAIGNPEELDAMVLQELAAAKPREAPKQCVVNKHTSRCRFPAVAGLTQCAKHREMQRVNQAKRRRAKQRSRVLRIRCRSCNKSFRAQRTQQKWCPACVAARKPRVLATLKRRRNRALAGLCVHCGNAATPGPRGGGSSCDECRAAEKMHDADRRAGIAPPPRPAATMRGCRTCGRVRPLALLAGGECAACARYRKRHGASRPYGIQDGRAARTEADRIERIVA